MQLIWYAMKATRRVTSNVTMEYGNSMVLHVRRRTEVNDVNSHPYCIPPGI